MTEPIAASAGRLAPLALEAVVQVRHDLRTFVNQILGYSEMLLETAAEEGPAELIAPLHRINDLGKDVLDLIRDRLNPGRTEFVRNDFLGLGQDLGLPIAELSATSLAMLPRVEQPGLDECLRDVRNLLVAVDHLAEFRDQVLLTEMSPAAAQVHTSLAGRSNSSLPAEKDFATQEPSGEAESVSGPGPFRILVVDDVEANRDVLRRRLERQGYKVVVVADGRQALQALEAGGIDLVLLDILMPEVDGFQVLQEVKSRPVWRDLPVIMISSLDEIQSVVRCIELGAEDFLPKPFDPVLLRARVGACLEKKRLRDQEHEYLRQVAAVTAAASAVEEGHFDPAKLEEVALRADELGRLARVFQRMGHEVQLRVQRLKTQVDQLKIEIDETRKNRQVAEVTGTDYFQQLRKKAQDLRQRVRKTALGGAEPTPPGILS